MAPETAVSSSTRASTPAELGVGARFSLHPMTDDFVPVILGALADAGNGDVEVHTDDVSTYLAGDDRAIVAYLVDVLRLAAERTPTGHVVASILLSRGCPGEVSCELGTDVRLPAAQRFDLPPTSIQVAAHWSLYPLGAGDHLEVIEAAIDVARDAGVYAASEHFATRLEGDLADVMGAIATAWTTVGASVQHVTTHVTVSIGSPTRRDAEVAR